MKSVKIVFSTLVTGACPSCLKFKKCHIIEGFCKVLEDNLAPKFGDTMELVIYTCPEYKERAK